MPVPFLPEYDNVLLSHQDRSRVLDMAELGRLLAPHEGRRHYPRTVLVDGRARATWLLDHDPNVGTARGRIDHLGLPPDARAAIEAEAHALLAFAAPDATPTVELHDLS